MKWQTKVIRLTIFVWITHPVYPLIMDWDFQINVLGVRAIPKKIDKGFQDSIDMFIIVYIVDISSIFFMFPAFLSVWGAIILTNQYDTMHNAQEKVLYSKR